MNKLKFVKNAFVKALMVLVMVFGPFALHAQDKVEFGASADIVSKVLWRGQNYGNVSIQPSGWVSYKGFSFGVWSSLGFTDEDVAEVDLSISYENGGFYATITDYWCAYYGDGSKYFSYKANVTPHVFEATVGYDFGFLDVNWSTNFAGCDGITKRGRRAYSSYFQATVPFSLLTVDWAATVGFTPWNTDYYYNATGFAVCDVSLQAAKEIKLSEKFSFSIFAKYCLNPSTMQTYFLGGISL